MTSSASSPTDARPFAAICACEKRLLVALGRRRETGFDYLCSQEWVVPASSMGYLAPALDHCLRLAGIGPGELERLGCVRGPGSFTGIRITLSFAAGIMQGAGVPLAGIDYLPLLAAAPGLPDEGVLAVMTYARRHQVYLQTFAASDRTPRDQVRALPLAEALAELASWDAPLACLGSGLDAARDQTAEALPKARLLHSGFDSPVPQTLLAAALAAPAAPTPVDPLYVRVSDAEENLASIAAKRGLSLDEAIRRLPPPSGDSRPK